MFSLPDDGDFFQLNENEAVLEIAPVNEYLPLDVKPYQNKNAIIRDFKEMSDHFHSVINSCLVCALTFEKRQELETDLFDDQLSYDEVSEKYGISVSDLKQHTQNCIIGNSGHFPLPKNDFLYILLRLITNLTNATEAAATVFANSPTPDNLFSYTKSAEVLYNKTVDLLNKQDAKYTSRQVCDKVLGAALLSIIERIIRFPIADLRSKLYFEFSGENDSNNKVIDKILGEFCKSMGDQITDQYEQSKETLAEIMGVKMKDLS